MTTRAQRSWHFWSWLVLGPLAVLLLLLALHYRQQPATQPAAHGVQAAPAQPGQPGPPGSSGPSAEQRGEAGVP